MTREYALQVMHALSLEARQSNTTLPIRLDEEMPVFQAADRMTGERVLVDARTYDSAKHHLLEDR